MQSFSSVAFFVVSRFWPGDSKSNFEKNAFKDFLIQNFHFARPQLAVGVLIAVQTAMRERTDFLKAFSPLASR